VNRWQKVGLSGTTFAKTAVTSDTFNLPNVANTMTVIEIDAATLDASTTSTASRVDIASPGANADLHQRDLPAVRRALPAGDAGRPQGRLSGPIS
jgi:hypothetical protein